MDGNRRYARFRTGLVVLLLLLVPLASAAAVDGEWKDHIIEHQRFTLKFISSFPGRHNVDVTDPLWPEGIEKISGPYRAQRTIQKEDGSYATVLQLIYTLRAGGVGIFSVPPVRISDGNEVQESETLRIPVLSRDESFLKYPLISSWQSIPETLYEGQAVPLVLMMHNMEEISLPESVDLPSPDGALLETVRGIGDIGFETVGEDTLFHVPMETWMITPSRPGVLKLGRASVRILGLTRRTAARNITVRPLPEELETTGAVGSFEYSVELPDQELRSGETAVLRIRVEGTGNLNYLVLPEPSFPDSLTVVRRELSEFSASSDGYRGYRALEYSLSSEEGRFSIDVPGFSWLDPATGRVGDRSGRVLELKVISLLDTLGQDEQDFALLPAAEVVRGGAPPFYRNPWLYLFLLPGPLLYLILRLKPVRRGLGVLLFIPLILSSARPESLSLDRLEQAQQAFEAGDYETALSIYETGEREGLSGASFLYNRGVLRFLNGRNAGAVADLRSALRIAPSHALIRASLDSIEESLDLDHQSEATVLLPPNLLFVLCLLSVNLFFIFLALFRMKGQSSWVILLLLLVSISSLGGTAELVRTVLVLSRREAVVKTGVILRRIPEERANPWVSLPEGTAVQIIQSHRDFVLIHTAYGLEGWIGREDLIPLEGGFREI